VFHWFFRIRFIRSTKTQQHVHGMPLPRDEPSDIGLQAEDLWFYGFQRVNVLAIWKPRDTAKGIFFPPGVRTHWTTSNPVGVLLALNETLRKPASTHQSLLSAKT